MFDQISNHVYEKKFEKKTRPGVYLTNFKVTGNGIKHCLVCYVIGFENIDPDSLSSRFRIRCRYIVSILESGLLNIQIRGRIRRLRVDGTRIRKEKLAD